jgi:hypothetical protein
MEELQARLTGAVETIDVDTIHRIWDEIAYGWDIYRVTQETRIEHLRISVGKIETYTAFCYTYGNSISFLLSVLLHLSFIQQRNALYI